MYFLCHRELLGALLRAAAETAKELLRVGYELKEIGKPDLDDAPRPLFG